MLNMTENHVRVAYHLGRKKKPIDLQMAKINQDLIERIQKKLQIGPSAVYLRIQNIGRRHHVARRDIAALLLAWELGISFQKYAGQEQLNRLDRITHAGDGPTPAARIPSPEQPTIASRKAKQGRPKKKTKDNSVFVVQGRDEALRKSMFAFLRALSLNPMEWEQAVHQAKGAKP